MKQKTASKIVRVLLIFSVVVIGGNALLHWWFPSWFGEEKKAKPQTKAAKVTSESAPADELPLDEINADQAMLNERQVISWPYDTSVHVFHQPNLQMHQGLARDNEALKGITVILDINADGSAGPAKQNTENSDTDPSDADKNDTDSDVDGAGENSENNDGNGENADSQGNGEEDHNGETGDADGNSENSDSHTGDPDAENAEGGPVKATTESKREILNSVQAATKKRLEELGAKVVLVERNGRDDTQQAAHIGMNLLSQFTAELKTQNFTSTRIEQLKPKLAARLDGSTESDPKHPIFPMNGVSRDLRLLLDVERQYTDYLYLNLTIGDQDAQTGGIRIHYLGNQAAQIGATKYNPENPQEQPAYIAYNTTARYRLAALLERNFSGLIPDLVNVEEPIEEKIMVLPRLTNLTHVNIEIGQMNHPGDIAILEQEAQRQVIAEAIANACYEFYCTTVLD